MVQDGQARMVSYLAGRLGRDGASKVRVFLVISFTYILFWGPLFAVTLINWGWEWKDAKKSLSHEVRTSQPVLVTWKLYLLTTKVPQLTLK